MSFKSPSTSEIIYKVGFETGPRLAIVCHDGGKRSCTRLPNSINKWTRTAAGSFVERDCIRLRR
jgi:hypothetical protein